MADIPMMASSSDDTVYIYAGRRFDLGSFLYIGESVGMRPPMRSASDSSEN